MMLRVSGRNTQMPRWPDGGYCLISEKSCCSAACHERCRCQEPVGGEGLIPLGEVEVGSDDGGDLLVALGDEIVKVFVGGRAKRFQAEVVGVLGVVAGSGDFDRLRDRGAEAARMVLSLREDRLARLRFPAGNPRATISGRQAGCS